jgi:tripartite-type tricarboxylate transporter receptor subunit TctC
MPRIGTAARRLAQFCLAGRRCDAFIIAFSVLAAPLTAVADTYPTRPVRMILPYSAGGPTDVYARVLGHALQEALKQPFVADNRPGAGTIIGTDTVAKSLPDGYTLLMMSSTHATNESLVPNKPYALLRDFVPVAPLVASELVLVVHPSVPAKNAHELIALAKARPGKLNYGSSGHGSNYHMAGELFKGLTGTDIVHVPYKGSGGARNDIVAGQIEMMFDSVPTMASLIQAGKVRPIGTSGRTRSDILPDVPTLSEAGVPGYEATMWIGMMAPKATPKPIVDLLNAEITKILNRPEVKGQWEKQGAMPMSMKPTEFETYIQQEIDKWAKIIKANNVKPE